MNEPGLPLQPYRTKLASMRGESHGVSWTVRGGDAVVTFGTSRRQVISVILSAAAATLVMSLRGKPVLVLICVLTLVVFFVLLRLRRRNRLTLRIEGGVLRTTSFPGRSQLRVSEMLSVWVYRNADGSCELLATDKEGSEHVLLHGLSQKQATVAADFLTQFLELGKPALAE